MRKTLPNPIELKACAYDDLQLFLQRVLQIFPVLESRLEVEQFLVQIPFGLAQMVTKETLICAGRKQPEKAFLPPWPALNAGHGIFSWMTSSNIRKILSAI